MSRFHKEKKLIKNLKRK